MLLKCGATPDRRSTSCSTTTPIGTSGSSRSSTVAAAVAAHTGADVHTWDGWAGSEGGHCVALGNGLMSSAVVHRMVSTFEGSEAPSPNG